MKQAHRSALRVLIVEDQPEMRNKTIPTAFSEYWPDADFEFLRTSTGSEALDILADEAGDTEALVDVIVLDVWIPEQPSQAESETEGLDVARALQAYRLVTRNSVIAIFTNNFRWEDLVTAIGFGADIYFPKKMLDMFKWMHEGKIEILDEFEYLVKSCKRVMESRAMPVLTAPDPDWMSTNRNWLESKFQGKWIAFVPLSTLKKLAEKGSTLRSYEEKDGFAIVTGSTLGNVRKTIMPIVALTKMMPVILLVTKTDV